MSSSRTYTYPPIGTTITDFTDGRVLIVFGRPGKNLDEVAEQALWGMNTFEKIHMDNPEQPLRLLFNLSNLYKISLDNRSRQMYKKILELEFVQAAAIYGDAFNFTKVLTITVLMHKHRERIKFFFDLGEAKKWLNWE